MKQHFWAEGSYLGSREVSRFRLGDPNGNARGTRLPHFNTAYFCPYCSEIWGRITFDEADSRWQVIARACRRDTEVEMPQRFDGCLQSSYPGNDPCKFAADWPVEAIRWEAETLLRKNYENCCVG